MNDWNEYRVEECAGCGRTPIEWGGKDVNEHAFCPRCDGQLLVDDEDIMMFTVFWLHEMWTETPERWWEWIELSQVHRVRIYNYRVREIYDGIQSGKPVPDVSTCTSILKHFEDVALVRNKEIRAKLEWTRRWASETNSQEDG